MQALQGKIMNLRRKTLLIIGLTIVSLVGTLYVISQMLVASGVAGMEQLMSRQSTDQVLDIFSHELSNLDAMAFDWAVWDDTYVFIQNANTNYIGSNLVDATFINLRLNFMLFFNSSNQLVFGKAFDLVNKTEIPIPQSLTEHLAANDLLLRHETVDSNVTGIVVLPETSLLVASRPILTSDQQSSIKGTLIIGRFLDAAERNHLFQVVQFPLAVEVASNTQMPSDFKAANASLSEQSPVFVQPLSGETIAGYALVNDVYGNPALIFRLDMPRYLYAQGQASAFYVVLLLTITGLVFAILTMLLLDKFVLSRLSRLGADVSKIGKGGDPAARVSIAGKDELAELASHINEMLSAIEKTGQSSRENEILLKQITENMFDMVSLSDVAGVYKYVSPSVKRTLGYEPNNLLGKSIFDFLHPDDLSRVTEAVQTALKTKSSGNMEYRYKHADGHYVWLEGAGNLILDADGQAIGAVISAHDVTERKQMEEALRESEEKIRSILQSSPDAITVSDLNGNLIDCNQADIEMFGYSAEEEMIGRNGFEFIAGKDRERATEVLTKVVATGIVKNFQCDGVAKDGREFPIEISVSLVRDASNNPKYLVGIIKDISQRKQMEDAIRESEEKTRNILQSSPDAIVVTDLNGTMIDCNQAALELGGVSSKEELLGKNTYDLISPKDYKKSMKNVEMLLKEGTIRDFEFSLVAKNGREFPAEVSMSLMKDTKGVPRYFVATIKDITERKQMQEKLQEYSQQLELLVEKRTKQLWETQEQLVKSERLAAIGQVAAMVGHDLRNPLTGIKGAAYYLKTKPVMKTDTKAMEMLELIEKDIEYSNKIIADLLEYSKEIHLELTETSPRSIIRETLSLLETPNNIQVVNLAEKEPKIKVDIEKLNRVFVNMIKNAFDAMPNGGKLTIKSRRTNGDVEFAFSDTGIGMTEDQMRRIWTPFFTTKAKGLGLGLSICKRIIEAHRGHISVESTCDKGTTFVIALLLEPKPLEGGEKTWVNVPESSLLMTTKASEKS
jgi:PAS domain S-box-containing protein